MGLTHPGPPGWEYTGIIPWVMGAGVSHARGGNLGPSSRAATFRRPRLRPEPLTAKLNDPNNSSNIRAEISPRRCHLVRCASGPELGRAHLDLPFWPHDPLLHRVRGVALSHRTKLRSRGADRSAVRHARVHARADEKAAGGARGRLENSTVDWRAPAPAAASIHGPRRKRHRSFV